MPSSLAVASCVLFAVTITACTVGAPAAPRGDAWPNVDAGEPPDARPRADADPIVAPEERFASACTRWHYWTEGNSAACEECRSASCAGVAIRAELHAHQCPGEFECVQDTCYPDGTAASIVCDCVLPCFTVPVCRDLWIDAMECVAMHCSDACGERPPD